MKNTTNRQYYYDGNGFDPRLPQLGKFVLLILLFFFGLFILSSCSSVKKTQTSFKKTVDSTSIKIEEHKEEKTVDTSTVKKKSEENTTDITIEFDPDDIDTAGANNHQADYPPKEEDYKDPVSTKKKKTITIKVDGGKNVEVDLGDNKPTNIHIKQTGKQEESDSSGKKTSIATTDKSNENTHVVRSGIRIIIIKAKDIAANNDQPGYWHWSRVLAFHVPAKKEETNFKPIKQAS